MHYICGTICEMEGLLKKSLKNNNVAEHNG